MDTKQPEALRLAPCPFCGGGARRTTVGTNAWFGTGCDGDQSCPAHLRALTHKTQAEADAAWNRRTPPAASELRRQHAENEALSNNLQTFEALGGAVDDLQLLRMGYDAARLEIESLQARVQELGQQARECSDRKVVQLEAALATHVRSGKDWAMRVEVLERTITTLRAQIASRSAQAATAEKAMRELKSANQIALQLDARIKELEAQLDAVGAGGVEPLRKRECLRQIANPVRWPKDAAEVREFFNSDFIQAEFAAIDQSPCDNDRYYISAHDFLSAIDWWADFPNRNPSDDGTHNIQEPGHFRGATKMVQAARKAIEALEELAEFETEGDPKRPAAEAIAALRAAMEPEPQ